MEKFEISAKCNGVTGKVIRLRPLLAHNYCCLTLCYQAAFCHVNPINNSRVKNKMSSLCSLRESDSVLSL